MNIQNDVSSVVNSTINESLSHSVRRPFKCQRCALSFDRASQLDYHYRSVHLGEKSQICQICGKGFFRKTDLRTHLNIHLGTNLCICEVCGRKFNHVSNLIRHCRMHAGIKPYPCSICGKRFTQISSLARHKRIHEKSKEKFVEGISSELQKDAKRQHYCKICGESFCFYFLLQEHEQSHLLNPGLFECKSCKKDFKKVEDVKDHRCEAINTDEPKVVKGQCGKDVNISKTCTNALNDIKKYDPHSMQSVKEVQSLETIIYITSEQLDKLNLEQKGDAAEDFLHKHLGVTEGKPELVDAVPQKRIDLNVTELLPLYTCDQILLSIPDSNLNTDEEDSKRSRSLRTDKACTENVSDRTESLQRVSDKCDLKQCEDKTENVAANASARNDNVASAEEKTVYKQVIREPALKKGKYNKYLNVDGNELYIEILEQEFSQFRELQGSADAMGAESNVNAHEETYFSREHNENVQSESFARNNENGGCAYCDSANETSREEPTLRLVQTETGEQFYELIISNLPEKLSGCQGSRNCETATDETSESSDISKGTSARTKDLIKRNSGKDVRDRSDQAERALKDLTEIHNDANYAQYVLQEHDKNFPLQHNEGEQNLYSTLNQQAEFERYVETNFEAFDKAHYENSNERFLEFVEITGSNDPHATREQDNGVQNFVQVQKSAGNAEVADDKRYNENVSAFSKDKPDYFASAKNDNGFRDIAYVDDDLLENEKVKNGKDRASARIDYSNKEHAVKASQETKKKATKKFLCNVCEKVFSTSYNYKQHIGTHFTDQQKFHCKECGVSFAWKSTLNKHLANHHRPDGPQRFVCEICPKVYSTLSQVNEHVKRDHLKERNHVCPHCGKSFFKKFDLKTHSRTHTNERPYTCRVCGKRFHHQSHIIRHERTHSGERPYVCDVCQKTFTQPGSLKVHRQKHGRLSADVLDCQIDEDDPVALVNL